MAQEDVAQENPQETIGFHKGCISTLIKEREELIKMVNVVEQITQAHINALKELGVDISQEQAAQEVPAAQGATPKKKKVDIEDLL